MRHTKTKAGKKAKKKTDKASKHIPGGQSAKKLRNKSAKALKALGL